MLRKYGWKPDLPDQRDQLFSVVRKMVVDLPPRVDLRSGCSKVEDQGQIGSCTANAIVACLEFLEIKATKAWVDLSRLFLYYKERELIDAVNEDSGAYIRDGIKVLAKIGTPHESEWPYIESRWNKKPTPAAVAGAKQHRIKDYQRLNSLNEMKSCLASGYPFVFGFSVYESFESEEVKTTGIMQLPGMDERMVGGHAVTAVGYDDEKGCLIVRNSWGVGWGDNGHFYMPYGFVTNRNLSDDFWTIRR
jgi:C1A family cysteine protease